MIVLDEPTREVPTELLKTPGAFAWWYAEVLDEDGTGVVLIWSFGLPFLPGYLSAARAGAPQMAGDRPSLNLSIYERGRRTFYALREFDPSEVSWADGVFCFGDTRIVTGSEGDRVWMEAELDVPLNGGAPNLTGHFRVMGTAPKLDPEDWPIAASPHRWTPLACPAFGMARLESGQLKSAVTGRAYWDRNHSPRDFSALGIERWIWARIATDSSERVAYILQSKEGGAPRAIGIELPTYGGTGWVREMRAEVRERGKTAFGMPAVKQIVLWDGDAEWLSVTTDDMLDSGPFYVRTHARDAAGFAGTVEVIVPDRIDLDFYRPLVRMRVTAPRVNSMWLPLFEGPSRGRVGRLLRSFAGGER